MGLIGLTHSNLALFLFLNHALQGMGDAFWENITLFGDPVLLLALLAPFVGRRPELLWAMALTVLLTTLGVHGCKAYFDVPRPPAVLPPESFHLIGPALKRHAFPSGHTAAAFAMAGLLALHGKGWTAWLPVPVALLVGLSRIALGVHWPLDALGGALAGWMGAVLGTSLARRLPFGGRPWVQRPIAALILACALYLPFHESGYPHALWLQWAAAAYALGTFLWRWMR